MSSEKIDIHYHHQLSALIDGELAPDQARFLLRRLQHDEELAACIDRWQLAGDVLRGNACAPAPHGFSARIAAALASEAANAGAGKGSVRGRGRAVMWGGGALAASVAAVALFLVVPQMQDDASPPSPTSIVQAEAARPAAPGPADRAVDAPPTLASSAGVDPVATARARPDTFARRSATRTRQAARSAAVAAQAPQRAVANAPLPVIHSIAVAPPESLNGNPFSDVRVDPTAPRPWPRAVLPQYSGGAFNARYPGERGARTFYPFDPKLPAAPTLTPPVPESGEDQ